MSGLNSELLLEKHFVNEHFSGDKLSCNKVKIMLDLSSSFTNFEPIVSEVMLLSFNHNSNFERRYDRLPGSEI